MINPHDPLKPEDIILSNHIKKTYFDTWRLEDNSPNEKFKILELMINSKCVLKCKYCYYNKYGSILHPSNITDEHTLENIDNLFAYLDKNNLCPPKITIFSGEPFEQNITYDVIDRILEFYKNKPKDNIQFSIPTGCTFIGNDALTTKVENVIQKAKDYNIPFWLSCSVDGKYCDSNRPYKSGFIRDDAWYDDLFKFCSKHKFNFHPMIYYDEIFNWTKNLQWWADMKEKYNLDDKYLYLLEVRNSGWTKEHIREMYKLSKYITEHVITTNRDLTILQMMNQHLDYNWFGIFYERLDAVTCGLEMSLAIRTADMKFYPCHRLQYEEFESGKLIFNDGDIEISSSNAEMYIASAHAKSMDYPICSTCDINGMCLGGCLGAQYEKMKDPFIPIPEVCAMEHAKIKGIIDAIIEIGREGEIPESALMARQINQIKGEMGYGK